MARFLLATTPVPGHVTPTAVLARRLVQRGHEVGWYTGVGFRAQVEAAGARHYPIRHAADWSLRNPHDVVPALRDKTGLAQVRMAFQRLFIDAAPASLADLEAITADFPADVVVANALVFADRWLHERGGPVHANLATTMYGLYSRDTAPFGPALMPSASPVGRVRHRAMNAVHRRVLFAPVNRHLDQVRRTVGLPPQRRAVLDTFCSPYLYLQDTVESFEYPRSDLPPQVHFVGPLLPDPPAEWTAPDWWPEVTSRRVVLVTQGTVRNEDAALFGPAIEALASEDVLVVITTGGGTVGLPADLPGNVRVIDHLPYAALMPHVSAYVTNGGYGGVQMALAHGVPLVVAGATEDKPEVAARVAWSGAGIRLRGQRPTPQSLRHAVTTVLTDPSYRSHAERLAAEISLHQPADEAAELLEQLARTQQPVLRSTASSLTGSQTRRTATDGPTLVERAPGTAPPSTMSGDPNGPDRP